MVSLRCLCSSFMFELASFSCWSRTTTRRPHHRDKEHAPARPFGLLYTSVLLSQKSTDRYRDRAKILTEIAHSRPVVYSWEWICFKGLNRSHQAAARLVKRRQALGRAKPVTVLERAP